ncbi:hypothetical protein [Nocardia cyriacigeorgica]|uniref:hypothetical protein n=1 Tax=Nocardia cyriacigeorgica TaxID=135487 RepID=UPI001895D17A|nr:hypothetical protein [Nocardia cyriacigeorgica]MBF6454518.1 hypothetical protein [Nocardia cyriacigeorgica]MBF6478769.1 hypothetical protein [Nocardia cyriacigeorgica]MBF6552412.1 hypothetical protein [Nocardia cyriacigeorgica]
MDYIDKAKHQVVDLVGKVVGASGGGVSTQTMTMARPRDEVRRFWRDPDNLSAVLQGIAQVREAGPDRLEWTFEQLGDDALRWETDVVDDADELRFTGEHDEQIRLRFADAPHDLGTEVTVRTTSPAPGLLTGAAAFTALYRARALLQTGEMPTLEYNPSGRRTEQEA